MTSSAIKKVKQTMKKTWKINRQTFIREVVNTYKKKRKKAFNVNHNGSRLKVKFTVIHTE